jgi:protein-disulfide isomerase
MHDLLYAHQDALTFDDFLAYARQLRLDEDWFFDDLDSRRFALRVARDVQSADASGVAGTPTFFINGRRHYGAYDLDSLTAAFRVAQDVKIGEAG